MKFFNIDDLENLSIISIDELEFNLRIYNINDWLADSIFASIITYNP